MYAKKQNPKFYPAQERTVIKQFCIAGDTFITSVNDTGDNCLRVVDTGDNYRRCR